MMPRVVVVEEHAWKQGVKNKQAPPFSSVKVDKLLILPVEHEQLFLSYVQVSGLRVYKP